MAFDRGPRRGQNGRKDTVCVRARGFAVHPYNVMGHSPDNRSKLQNMNTNYTAVVKQDSGWWIGWIEEVPGVNCQEPTREELLESLQVTLREALELNRSDAIRAAGSSFEELEIAV